MCSAVIIIRVSKWKWCALESNRTRGGFASYDLTADTPRYKTEADATIEARRLSMDRDAKRYGNSWLDRSQPHEM